jgi:ribosomal protein L16 Arg81 hydroxylase
MERRDDPGWLAELVAPVSASEFLSTYWLRQHLFCRRDRDRFAPLISWPVVNDILEHHWRETNRFRLAHQGRDLDPTAYADLDGSRPRIRSRDVTDHLRRGATLSFDALDEVHTPLRRLAESFEAFFRAGTTINLYAGWRALHGLDLHRDDHEIFILHVDGRKRWLLYGSSVDGIDRGELSRTSVPPAGALADLVLEPGDLLYIPRGCYHVAVPMNEPALHLTLGVKNPRGIDLLLWMVEKARAADVSDRDLPALAGAEEQREYGDELQRALLAGREPNLVEQYFADAGRNLKPRPSFSFPWSATSEALPPGKDFRIMLKDFSRMVVRSDAGAESIEVQCGRRTWRLPRSMQSILEQLSDGTPQPIGRVIDAAAGRLDEAMVRLLVGMLVRQDLVDIIQ